MINILLLKFPIQADKMLIKLHHKYFTDKILYNVQKNVNKNIECKMPRLYDVIIDKYFTCKKNRNSAVVNKTTS